MATSTYTRRAFASGASLTALAIPAAAQCVLAVEPDPIFPAIQAHKDATTAFREAIRQAGDKDPPDDFCDNEAAAAQALVRIIPTTLAGVVALLEHVCSYDDDCFTTLYMEDSDARKYAGEVLLRSLRTSISALVR